MNKIVLVLISALTLLSTQACAQRKTTYELNFQKAVEAYYDDDDDDKALELVNKQLDEQHEIKTPIPGRWTERLNQGQRFDNPRIASLAMSFQRYFLPDQVVDDIQTQLEFGFASEKDIFYETFLANTTAKEMADACQKLIVDNNLNKGRTVIVSRTYRLLRALEQQIRLSQGCSCMTTFETQEVYDKILAENDGNIKSEHFIDTIKDVRDNKKLHFTMDTEQLKLSSIHSYKGWDADNVILIIQPDDDLDDFGESAVMGRPELIYTAITRAKQNLFVLNMGNGRFDDFFRTQSY